MKKLVAALAIVAAAVMIASCGKGRTKAARLLENYAEVTVPAPDLSGLTENGKEVLNLYRFAADQADAIYWQQNYGTNEFLTVLSDPAEKTYAQINYGPWDRIDNQPFIEGFGPKPAGARFYPDDMTDEEFEAIKDPAKNSPYTLIQRKADGSLEVVWYHDAYKEQVEKMADLLRAAADITIKTSVREYLLQMAQAVKTDRYYSAQHAWLQMTDSKMDLVIGPTETIDDERYGKKASYGAYVLLKNEERTQALQELCDRLPELQASLPGESAYRQFVPGAQSNIFSCDVLYYAGYPNAGYKNIAVNLPYDATVQEHFGTRTILFDNIIREKYNRTVFPAGMLLLEADDQAHLDASAFYWNIVFREVAQSLGVKETVNGKGSVADALGNEALTLEKAKSNVLGTYLCMQEVAAHRIDALIMKQDVLATFITNVIRSTRFGTGDATGRANLIIYNYLLEQGAIERKASGKYDINYVKAQDAVTALGELILKLQATGDAAGATQLAGKYAVVPSTIKADIVNLELEKIPVDIRLTYEK
ncbi:MAG: hypothetical protein IK074_07380 [Bacteroidales bacterium]|nr:hypothetical protein [Bacteroidales bacterium]